MQRFRAVAVLCFVTFIVVLPFFFTGCRSTVRAAVKEGVAAPAMEAAGTQPVKTTKQNLSMAQEIKDLKPAEYVLGPEDKLRISVFRRDEMTTEVTVSTSGRISYYLAGDMDASGLTAFELRDRLQAKLVQYIKAPEVYVEILEHRSHKVFVLGQVNNPGVYRMKNDYTLLEAISESGGITRDAYLDGAYVVRDGKVLIVNFYELLEKGNMGENIPLVKGDVIYIPDNRDHKVFVLGEVRNQAAIPIRAQLTLIEAIAEAGGFTQDAKKDSIVIMRGNLSEPEIMQINAEDLNVASRIPLRRGDIVYVASSTIANVERAAVRLSHILQPFLQVARGIILSDTAADVLEGESLNTKVIVGD
jgi:polysaccharide export outer membrane protein